MSDKPTPGQALRARLDEMLPPSVEWTEQELATFDLIEHAADRLGPLRKRFDVLVRDPEVTEARLASLQTAIHQLEGRPVPLDQVTGSDDGDGEVGHHCPG